jgi:nickel-dependent lactate racemase
MKVKDNQHEQLFTELTPAEAAVVEGGGSFTDTVYFDEKQTTQRFSVRPGGSIILSSNTHNDYYGSSTINPTFYAAIRNVNTGNKNEKVVDVGADTTTWTNVIGGTYVIDFRDLNDEIYVHGPVTVSYS